MKILAFSIFVLSSIFGYSNDAIQSIYQEARKLAEDHYYDDDLERLIYEFYKRKVGAIDIDILQKCPEIVFRKAMAQMEIVNDLELGFGVNEEKVIVKFLQDLSEIQKDLTLVVNYSEKGSRLHQAATFRSQLIEAVLSRMPQNLDELLDIVRWYQENLLRQWASNPNLSGRNLREDILHNIWANPTFKDAFFKFILLTNDNPDIALGLIEPVLFEVTHVDEDGELSYRMEYFVDDFRKVRLTAGL